MSNKALNNGLLLIIDDEPLNLKLLERMLGDQGYQDLMLVSDPREVLERYLIKRPDLILLDINMPYLDGFQVMDQLKALNDPLLPPIIILTAQHGKDFLLRALAGGARDFITKPFDRNELLMRVRNLLDAQLAHRLLYDQNAVLEQLVQERTKELNRARLQIVQRLGMAAECKDEITGNHIMRMSHYSALLARAVGWNEAECELLLHASPMHDIGKIGIPDAILSKPGKLEAHELEVMKTHASIGGKLLEGDDSALMFMALEIALTHHEKWDGSGYPNGLAGEAIPQCGRITALTDVFDALTSTRSYKKAWTVDAAVTFIKENSGAHFDPVLVEAFLQKLPQILEIRAQFPDPEDKT